MTAMSPRTVADLIAGLQLLPQDALVLVQGYEGGYSPVDSITLREVQLLDRDSTQDYLGPYEASSEALRQAALTVDDRELAIAGINPPRLLGEPEQAVLLNRRVL